MTFSIPFVIAQAAPGGAGASPGVSGLLGSPIILMVVMFGAVYFLMIRPQMKRQKELRTMLSALAKGDEVVTNGGIAGRIDEVGETFISVEIATNVVVKVQKGSVSQVLPKGSLKSV
jgi:preprotein translocase subunit YajC